MNFYLPVTLYAEEHCVRTHQKELAALGTKALLVTGRRSARLNGSLADVTEALDSCGVSCALFDEIEENPSIETVMKARDRGLAEGVDFVVGIGGGSPMDAAKAIALMIRHGREDASYLYRAGADSSALPVAAVPTTCGTGSEVTPYAILTIHEKRTKSSISHRIFPALALLDPRYLLTAPASVLCDTAVDAFGHLAESWFNANATDYSRMCTRQGLEIWSRSRAALEGISGAAGLTPETISDATGLAPETIPGAAGLTPETISGAAGLTPETCLNLLNASAMAGMAISHTGTSLPHGLSYYLTYEAGVPHGKAVGYFLAGYLREAPADERDAFLKIAGFSGLRQWEEFYAQVCRPQPASPDILEQAVRGLMQNPAKLKNSPWPASEAMLRRICR